MGRLVTVICPKPSYYNEYDLDQTKGQKLFKEFGRLQFIESNVKLVTTEANEFLMCLNVDI